MKPTFSDKGPSNSKITLIENDTLILNDKEVVETINDYCVSIADSLYFKENSEVTISTEGVSIVKTCLCAASITIFLL